MAATGPEYVITGPSGESEPLRKRQAILTMVATLRAAGVPAPHQAYARAVRHRVRERRRRALITTLLVSQGVPMVRHGDELGHSQRGNNNAYCQDNELSWLDWEHADKKFLDFCAELVAFRHRHPVFRRHFFEDGPSSIPDCPTSGGSGRTGPR